MEGRGQGPRTRSGPQGKMGPCVQREPTGRSIIVIENRKRERADKRQRKTSRESEREKYEMRETREEKRKGDTRREGHEGETLPCARSTRFRVCVQQAPVCTFKTPVSHFFLLWSSPFSISGLSCGVLGACVSGRWFCSCSGFKPQLTGPSGHDNRIYMLLYEVFDVGWV